MNRAIWILSCVILAAPVSAEAGPWRNGADGHRSALLEQERDGVPMLVYFRAEWCGYCKQLDRDVLADKSVGEYLGPFAKVQINPDDGGAHRALAQQYGIRGYPSLFVIMPGKKPVKVSHGGGDPDAFVRGVRAVAGTPKARVEEKRSAVLVPVIVMEGVPQEIFDLQEEGRHTEALVRLTRLIDLNGKKPGLRFARAVSYRAEGRHSDAAEDLDYYLRAKPDDETARLMLARTYLNLTMHEDAAETLQYLVDKKPHGEALWLLAEAETKLGKKAQAQTHYADACKAGYKAACTAKKKSP